jgi:hypothetical protein
MGSIKKIIAKTGKNIMSKKPMTWRSYYKLPLKLDYGYAFSANNNMALTFFSHNDVPKNIQQSIVDRINGEVGGHFAIPNLKVDGVDFKDGETDLFCVRGWGGLIGIGGLNLSEKKAAKIQDDFVEYITKQLT